MRIVFCGHGRAGKDTACEIFSQAAGVKNAGTVSKYLTKYVAKALGDVGLDHDRLYETRADHRAFWRRVGDEVRANDPALLVREMLAAGHVGGGVRGLEEIRAARAEGLFDLAVWVDNPRVPNDPTMGFGPEECDVVIQNHGTLAEFEAKVRRLAWFWTRVSAWLHP